MAAKLGDGGRRHLGSPNAPSATPSPNQALVSTQVMVEGILKQLAPPKKSGELGRLGGYGLLRILSQGGLGMLFEAEDEKTGRRLAVKVIQPNPAAQLSAEHCLHQARTAASIRHPHIVEIYRAGEENGVLFVAMPLLQGESLETRLLRESRLPLAEAMHIARETAEALATAHGYGLVHRNLKPANIWLERVAGQERPRVKVLDFGLATTVAAGPGGLPESGVVLGTPGYLAPEQARNLPLDPRCDLFSLGCVLYHMVTGRAPFAGKDAVALLIATSVDRPQSLKDINPATPRPLVDLVQRLLAKAPKDRPIGAKAVVQELQALERPAAPPQPPLRVAPPPEMTETDEPPAPPPPATRPPDPPARAESARTMRRASESARAEPAKTMERASEPVPAPADPQPSRRVKSTVTDSWAKFVPGLRQARETMQKLAAEESAESAEQCPECNGKLSQMAGRTWCLACGYDSRNAEAEPEPAPEPVRVTVPAWVFGLLLGCAAIILVTVFRESVMPRGSWALLWWVLFQAGLGLLVYSLGHVWLIVMAVRYMEELELWKYLDPTIVWKQAVALMPKSRHPVCLGSWGATAILCAFVVFWANDFSFKSKHLPPPAASGAVASSAKPPEQKSEDFPDSDELAAGPAKAGKGSDIHILELDGDGQKTEPARTDCVVAGYVADKDGYRHLVLAERDEDGSLRYAGTVSQFGKSADMKEIQSAPIRLPSQGPPLTLPSQFEKPDQVVWLDREVRCTVDYSQKEAGGVLKDPVLQEVTPSSGKK
jgi:serine/threonine protein kinase